MVYHSQQVSLDGTTTTQTRLQMARDMPWIVTNELRRWAVLPYIRLVFSFHGIAWGKRWRIWGAPIIQRHRRSRIELGDGMMLRSWRTTNPLTPNHPVVLATRSENAVIRTRMLA
jgi:hypothetical protein